MAEKKSDRDNEGKTGLGATLAWVAASVLAVSCCALGTATIITGFASIGALFGDLNPFVSAFMVFIASVFIMIWITRRQQRRRTQHKEDSHGKLDSDRYETLEM